MEMKATAETGRPPALLAYSDGVDGPRTAPAVVAAATGAGPVEVLMGWTPESRSWLSEASVRGRTVMAGYAVAEAVAAGRLHYLPVRLSTVPRLLADLRPDIAVVTGVRRGRNLVYRGTVGFGPAATRVARAVVVEVDRHGADLGGPPIEGDIVTTFERPAVDGPPLATRGADEVDFAVGRNVRSVLPEDPTLQFGPGGISEGVVAALDRPVRIWSGLVTEAVADLDRRGLLRGHITAAYVWGGPAIEAVARAGKLRLLPVEETHDIGEVARIDRFVGCNTALQVGLDGSVNVERVAGRSVAGIGGHADFCAAAARSAGGVSVIALRSTTRGGQSTIVPQVEVVSTPRCDVEVVVTEHGVADLRGVDDDERARRIATVAAPQHRAWLADAAHGGAESSRPRKTSHP
jgi:acyl-CoA hydrolase